MKLKKAKGKLYSLIMIEERHELNAYSRMSLYYYNLQKQVVVNSITKVISIVENLGVLNGFATGSKEKLRANICKSMPETRLEYSTNNEGSNEIVDIYKIYIKQHGVDVGVVFESDDCEEDAQVSAAPF